MSIWSVIKEFFLGPEPTFDMREIFPTPPGFLEHKDHMELCPECRRHYLCRNVVCHIWCARCLPKKENSQP